MKRLTLLLRIVVVLGIIQISACEKIIEHLPGKPKNCRIQRIFFHNIRGNHYGYFYYNKWGNPDSVIYEFTGTALTNQFFKYNSKRQLIRASFKYSGGDIERLHKYGYTNGVITTDTSYSWPSHEEPEPLSYTDKVVVHLEYDNLGRIIKETRIQVYPVDFMDIWYYEYDANGNRGIHLYDNYTNPNVLHPIWQFLSRDYSLNNPVAALSYNNYRLPTKFGPQHILDHQFLDRSLVNAEFVYECK